MFKILRQLCTSINEKFSLGKRWELCGYNFFYVPPDDFTIYEQPTNESSWTYLLFFMPTGRVNEIYDIVKAGKNPFEDMELNTWRLRLPGWPKEPRLPRVKVDFDAIVAYDELCEKQLKGKQEMVDP